MFEKSKIIDDVPVKIKAECELPKEVAEDVFNSVKGRWQLDQVKKCTKWITEWNELEAKRSKKTLDVGEWFREAGRLLERRRQLNTSEIPFLPFAEITDDFFDQYRASYRVTIEIGERGLEEPEAPSLITVYRELGMHSKYSQDILKRLIVRDRKRSPLDYSTPEEYIGYLKTIDLSQDMGIVNKMIAALKQTLPPEESFITDVGRGLLRSVSSSLDEVKADYERQIRDPPPSAIAGAESANIDLRLQRHLREIANEASESWKWLEEATPEEAQNET